MKSTALRQCVSQIVDEIVVRLLAGEEIDREQILANHAHLGADDHRELAEHDEPQRGGTVRPRASRGRCNAAAESPAKSVLSLS